MKKINNIVLLIFCTIYFNISKAQNLPVGMTESEKYLMKDYLNSIESKGFTTPPKNPVRSMAEWEEIQAITITWTSYESVLKEIVRHAKLECRVIIICTDSNAVKTYLTTNNITLSNISFLKAPYNSVWIRDYMGNSVYKNNVDSLYIVDWIYNRPRPSDDAIPAKIATFMNLPLYQTTQAPYALTHTGGNYMSDGFGTAFSEDLIVDENSNITNAQIDTIMKKFMGINRYVKVTNLPYDGIHHIDMNMKLLDEETILAGKYPQGIADGPQIESNINFIKNRYNSVFGTPYKFVRIPMPPDPVSNQYPDQNSDYFTYTNSMFINKTLLFPTYYTKYDTIALRIYKENLPGYKIIGINCNQTIPASGAIHCIVHEIGSKEPLLISHKRISDTLFGNDSIIISAKIMHKSGIQQAQVFYRTDTTQPYQSVLMYLTDSLNNNWKAKIAPLNFSSKIYYYIKATAYSGKVQARPITAPAGYWKFYYDSSVKVNEAEKKNKFEIVSIYPNPANNYIYLSYLYPKSHICNINLLSVLGNKIRSIQTQGNDNQLNELLVDLSDIDSGMYILEFNIDNNNYYYKIVKK